MRVYLAGPMRTIPFFNFPQFHRAAKKLRECGFEVINPAELDEARGFDACSLPADTDWSRAPATFDLKACIREDVESVLRADAVVLLPMWWRSAGAVAEAAVAKWAGKLRLLWTGDPAYMPVLTEGEK